LLYINFSYIIELISYLFRKECLSEVLYMRRQAALFYHWVVLKFVVQWSLLFRSYFRIRLR